MLLWAEFWRHQWRHPGDWWTRSWSCCLCGSRGCCWCSISHIESWRHLLLCTAKLHLKYWTTGGLAPPTFEPSEGFVDIPWILSSTLNITIKKYMDRKYGYPRRICGNRSLHKSLRLFKNCMSDFLFKLWLESSFMQLKMIRNESCVGNSSRDQQRAGGNTERKPQNLLSHFCVVKTHHPTPGYMNTAQKLNQPPNSGLNHATLIFSVWKKTLSNFVFRKDFWKESYFLSPAAIFDVSCVVCRTGWNSSHFGDIIVYSWHVFTVFTVDICCCWHMLLAYIVGIHLLCWRIMLTIVDIDLSVLLTNHSWHIQSTRPILSCRVCQSEGFIAKDIVRQAGHRCYLTRAITHHCLVCVMPWSVHPYLWLSVSWIIFTLDTSRICISLLLLLLISSVACFFFLM